MHQRFRVSDVCGASNFGCEQRVQELAQVPTNQAAAVSKGDRERSLLEARNPMGKLVGLGPCEGFGSPPGSWSWRPVRPCRARARSRACSGVSVLCFAGLKCRVRVFVTMSGVREGMWKWLFEFFASVSVSAPNMDIRIRL